MKLVLSWRSSTLNVLQVYFNMLDAFLAEEKVPDEYAGKAQVHHCFHSHTQTSIWYNFQIYLNRLWKELQVILCNDCEKRGEATFHWLYHKCSYCGSYNTRLLWFCFRVSGNNFFIKLLCVERWACVNNLDFTPLGLGESTLWETSNCPWDYSNRIPFTIYALVI